jgi:hypothetical protein
MIQVRRTAEHDSFEVVVREGMGESRHHVTKECWASSGLMLGKLSIIGAVAAILMIPTALSAQMGGAINPGVHVGGTVNPGATVRGAVERGIPGPDFGTWRSPSGEVHRSRKHTKATTRQRR